MDYEKSDPITGERYTWNQGESLAELAKPERVSAIKSNYARMKAFQVKSRAHLGLKDVYLAENDAGETPCIMCHL
jgi:hypothetical protein